MDLAIMNMKEKEKYHQILADLQKFPEAKILNTKKNENIIKQMKDFDKIKNL